MKILIISGVVAGGKSTASKLYAKSKSKCALIETDDVRHMVVSQHTAPWKGNEGIRQLELGVSNTCLLAKRFVEAGFDVVIADFVTSRTLPIYKKLLQKHDPYVVQLVPSFQEAKRRFDVRTERVTDSEFKMLYEMQAKFIEADLRIDNTSLSPQELVDRLLLL